MTAPIYLNKDIYRHLVGDLLAAPGGLDPVSVLADPDAEPPLEVVVVDALCDAVAALAIDTRLAATPELRDHVLAILFRELAKVPVELMDLASAETDKQLAASFDDDDMLARFDRFA